jgi:hypothetical protein
MESLEPDPVPNPTAPAKAGRSSGQLLLLAALIITALAGTALALLAFLFFISSPSRLLGAPRTEQRVVSRLVYDSGRGDTISEEFDVPQGCRKVVLNFSGDQIDHDIDVAWVGFRVYDRDIADYSIDSSGPHDLLDSGDGSSRLTLPAGSTYYVETSAFNATWNYRINCE